MISCNPSNMMEYLLRNGYQDGKKWVSAKMIAEDTGWKWQECMGALQKLYDKDYCMRENRKPSGYLYSVEIVGYLPKHTCRMI